jgi:hypothetical protein
MIHVNQRVRGAFYVWKGVGLDSRGSFPEEETMWGFVGRHSGVHATWSRCSL